MSSQNTKHDLIRLASIKAAQTRLATEKAEIEARLVTLMKSSGSKSASVQIDGESITGTLVEVERVVIKEDALKKALTAAQWKKVTVAVLDKERLEAAVLMGDIDDSVVAASSEIKANKPFIKVSGKVPDSNLLEVGVENGAVVIHDDRGLLKPAVRKRAVKAAKPA